MRRLVSAVAALALLAGLAPGTVSAAARQCSIDVTPSTGGPTTIYRITGSNFPVSRDGGSVEVRIDIRRLGSREGAILFVFLVPGVTEFYVDYNTVEPGEPTTELAEGRYLVLAETAHLPGCHATDRFVVTG
jgi:hypothetical protein